MIWSGCGGGGEKRWPGTSRVGGGPPRSTAVDRCGGRVVVGPAVEKPPLGGLLVIGDHDVELAPFAPRQVQRCKVEASNPISMATTTSTAKVGRAPAARLAAVRFRARHQDDPADQRKPQPIPEQPERAKQRKPRSESRHARTRNCRWRESPRHTPRRMNGINRHRKHSAERESAAELTLGGWHFARRARIDRDRRAQRPRQTLEAGFGDMVAVLAI